MKETIQILWFQQNMVSPNWSTAKASTVMVSNGCQILRNTRECGMPKIVSILNQNQGFSAFTAVDGPAEIVYGEQISLLKKHAHL